MIDNNKPSKVILFDWDNTIIQSQDALKTAMQAVIDAGFQLPADIRQRYFGTSFRTGFPHLFGEHWQEAMKVFHKSFDDCRTSKPHGLFEFLPDAELILQQLHAQNFQMGVLSNRVHDHLYEEVGAMGLKDLFFAICGSGPSDADKPDISHGKKLLEMGGFADMLDDSNKRKNIVMIGDSKVDMLLAKNMEVAGILLNNKTLASEDFFAQGKYHHISYLKELPELLAKHMGE